MRLLFSKQVFAWLIQSNILKHPSKQETSQGHLVSYDDAIYFQNGYKIRLIFKLLKIQYNIGLRHLPMIRKITVLHQNQNWLVIKNTLDKLGVPLTEEEIYGLHEDPAPITRVVNTLYKDFYMTRKFAKKKITVNQPQKEFNPKTFEYDKDLALSSSSLEFISLLLTKHFSITVQEALGMLIDESLLLARVILQGTVEQGFVKVQSLFDELLQNVSTLANFLEQQPNSAKFIMKGFRCGFFSGSYDIVQKTILIVKRAGLKDWLVEIDKGKSVFLGLQRYPSLSEQLLGLISSSFGANLIPLVKQNFAIGLKKNIQLFMGYAKQLISFMRSSLYRKEFLESGILEQLLQVVLKSLEAETIDTSSRLLAINILTQLLLTEDFLKNLRYLTTIRRFFQTAQPLLLTFSSKLSLCDTIFKQHQQSNIKLFYHILCFLLKSQNNDILEFVLYNLKTIFQKYSIVSITDFLQAIAQLDLDQPAFVRIFTQFSGRSLDQKDLKLIAQWLLKNYQRGLQRAIYGRLLISIIKSNYQNSEEIIMISVRTFLSIFCESLTHSVEKSKKYQVKSKHINEFTPQQEQQILALQYAHNTAQVLVKLLKAVKQQHHEQVFKIIEEYRGQLKKKKGSGKEFEKFMRALADRRVTEENEDEQDIKIAIELSGKKDISTKNNNKMKQEKRETDNIQQVESAEEQENQREKSIDKKEGQFLYKSDTKEQKQQGLDWDYHSNENDGQAQEPDHQQLFDPQDTKPSLIAQKSSPISLIVEQQPTQNSEKEKIAIQKQLFPQHQDQQQDKQQENLRQFSEQPIAALNSANQPDLQEHQLLFISYIRQAHKLQFEYLMLLVHQQGMDEFSSDYSLKTLFENNYNHLVAELLEKKDIEVGEFAEILMINSLNSPGVNRMMGIVKLLQYFKRQTIKMKGNIRVFEEKESGLQKLNEQKDGFKQARYRIINYVSNIKNKGIDQKYRICYQIVNQILIKKFDTSSIQHMSKIIDTVSAEELGQKGASRKSENKVEPQTTSSKLEKKLPDQQRKDKITARIKMMEKQSKPNKL